MNPAKTTLVADLLHYPIALTPLEKYILGTPIFNRLHNVNQNSTAYLTFPAINHSRFSHSLGAMTLAGQLFYYGVMNSEKVDSDDFFKKAGSLIDKICIEFDATDHPCLGNSSRSPAETDYFSPFLGKISALNYAIPHFLKDSEKYYFCVLLQGLRIAALVHDLGHPPFSHVTEYALLDVKDHLRLTPDHNDRQQQFMRCLKNSGGGANEIYPHEALTLTLYKELIKDVLGQLGRDVSGGHGVLIEQYCYSWLSLWLAGYILSEGRDSKGRVQVDQGTAEHEVLRCLHLLTAGDLDGDRLDYIQRDAILAGIKGAGLRAERLIQLMRLVHVVCKDSETKFPRIVPSVRSLRSLEEYFSARFELYRSVIFHHHVVKTDGLFQAVVKDLAIRWLAEPAGITSPPEASGQGTLILKNNESDISWLWLIFDEKLFKNRGTTQRNHLYMQWDDYWLLSLLRSMYIALHDKPARSDEDDVLYLRLEEIIASKRNYISLIKRFEDFCEVEEEFLRELRQIRANHPFSFQQAGFDHPNAASSMAERAKQELEGKLESGSADRSLRLSTIIRMATDGMPVHHGVEDLFSRTSGARDLLLIYKSIKPGFGKDFMVQSDGGPKAFSEYSVLAKDMEDRESRWPLFFAYALKPTLVTGSSQLRAELGRSLAVNFYEKCCRS